MVELRAVITVAVLTALILAAVGETNKRLHVRDDDQNNPPESTSLERAHWCRHRNGTFFALGYTYMQSVCSMCQCTSSRIIRCSTVQCMPAYCIDDTMPNRKPGHCCAQCGYEAPGNSCLYNGVPFPHGSVIKSVENKMQCWCQWGTIECRDYMGSLFESLNILSDKAAIYIIVIVLCIVLFFGLLICCSGTLFYYYYYQRYQQSMQQEYDQYVNSSGWQPMSEEDQNVTDLSAEEKRAEAEKYQASNPDDFVPPPYAAYHNSFIIETYRSISNKGISRNKPTVNFSMKSLTIKPTTKCGQCEKDEANMKCLECVENYCANCFTHFHLRGALQRHHRIILSEKPLSIFQKKKQLLNTSINLRELSYRQSKDDLNRTSIMTLNMQESEQLCNQKTNFASCQQSFLHWRGSNIHKSKQVRQKHELISSINETTGDKIDYFNRLPNIKFNSSKIYQHTDKNNQKFVSKRLKKSNIMRNIPPKKGVLVNIYYSLSDHTDLNEPNIGLEPFDGNLLATQTAASIQTTTVEENSNNVEKIEKQERPITHISTISKSRSTSSSTKKDLIPSRPNSIPLFQQSLRSLLDTKSNDELQAIVNSQLILSRSSSSTPKKLDQSPTLLNRNCIPEQSISNNKDVQSTVIDESSNSQSDLDLDKLFDESKIESINRLNHQSSIDSSIQCEKEQSSTHVFCANSLITTPRRSSPFSFTNSINNINRINSSSSTDTNDDGFFTDVLPRQPISSTRIFQCSKSNEWIYASENQSIEDNQTISESISICKSSIESLVRTSSKDSIKLIETYDRSTTEFDNNSRSGSSLSSASLPVSITSSKTDFINRKIESSATSSRRNSSSSIWKSSSSSLITTKTLSSQSETRTPIIVKNTKVTSSCKNNNEPQQDSSNTLKEKSLSNVHTQQSSNDLLKLNLIINSTEDENITSNDLPIKETTHRQTTTSNKSSRFRKLEFSMEDGLKWHEISTESFSSNQSSQITNFRLLTSSKSINTKFFQHLHQNINDDEECLNQVHQEHCSTLNMKNSNEDAIMNEHLLQNLEDIQLPSNIKDLSIIYTKSK
ncbi:unnamed protein product [Rotaria sp. Silwood1]|nr:unnamed protein product [Rotaria sp. Silwood1]